MPTYDYQCKACGHAFEEFQMMSDKVLRKCPECKKLKLERLLGTGAGIIFKGSGFYETDYKRKSGGKSESPSKSESKSESKKDSSSKSGSKTSSKKDD